MKTIRLREGKERSLQRHHPWIFESAIAKGGADPGETVRVDSHDGRFLAWAAFSPQSKIRARVWSFDQNDRVDAAFLRARISNSIRARALFNIQSDGLRLVHGESDGLPGLVVDRYGDTLVAQFSSAGVERFKPVLIDALLAATGCTELYERSDTHSRRLEGLPDATGWLRGADAQGPPPSTDRVIHENGWKLGLNIAHGHKTGYYLDQRDNRGRFAHTIAHLCRLRAATPDPAARPLAVLNCYCYTGGFSVAALAGARQGGGAVHVTSIDSSAPALAQARANAALNGLDAHGPCDWLDADVNASLRTFLRSGRRFDAIVLDPPKLAPTVAHAERAARAYKDINRLALSLLNPGGVLHTYSCSGGIGPDLFHQIVASSGADARVDAYIIDRLGAAPDHPMTLAFPEGAYLKGLVVVRR